MIYTLTLILSLIHPIILMDASDSVGSESQVLQLKERNKIEFEKHCFNLLLRTTHTHLAHIELTFFGSKIDEIKFITEDTESVKTDDGARLNALKALSILTTAINQNNDIQPFLGEKHFPTEKTSLDVTFIKHENEPETLAGPSKINFDGETFRYFHGDELTRSETLEEAKRNNTAYEAHVKHVRQMKNHFIDELEKQFISKMGIDLQTGYFSNTYPDIHDIVLEATVKKNTRTPDDARPYVVQAISIVLDYLNNTPKVQPYLAEQPFIPENIYLRLGFENPWLPNAYGVCLVYYNQGEISYGYVDNKEQAPHETFEEAKQKLLQSRSKR